MSSTAEPSTAEIQTGTHFHVYGGTGGPGGAGGQHGGEGGSGEGGSLIHGNQIATLKCPPASLIFQGRQEILHKMQQYFAQDNKKRRVYVLHGLGGSGKTQIALKFLEETSDEGLAKQQKQAFSGHKKWTLLFDNADDPKLKLWPFFPQCTHGNIIITSRNPQLGAYSPGAHCQVGDLDEDNAVLLLLATAVQEDTDETRKLAVAIVQAVQEISCLPLAIVHAGAYIAKFKGLVKYLSIYRQNKEELLRRHPDHAHDNYEWTVYTTWQISYERLSPVAARFLQLCALLHHSKIPESIFCKATEWMVNNEGSETGSMREAREFLQHFVSSSGSWQDQHFRDTVAEIEEYSLLQRDEASSTLSMHPLVHLWCSGTQPYQREARGCMVDILGMAIDPGPGAYLMRIGLIAHVKMLVQDDLTLINSEFWNQFGQIYHDGGQFRQARRINELWVEQCQKLLGDDHPDTLIVMANLAATYSGLGRYQEAELLQSSVLARRPKLLGDDHPDTLNAMADLAATYSELGRFQEAEPVQAK
ncbi:P-loop containing nucleoside triphosphate hydrolase protein [Roridomyces roridus]|uniref:P-loop containing nucleoside triphosphate hydrolase protein n=1 Tax=Roridomyces roridus TaxID=1738132 RepID=A0AAD7FIH5_9AGAR|nr:P-loop containing nucleoside triphosphate hydrolase protein [Roridomyces roridus]